MVKKWYPSMGKGELKSFKYEGGENPGARRIVYVLSDTNTRNGAFSAYCFTRKQIRTFSSDKCVDVQDVDDYTVVELENLPVTLQSGEILQKEYVKDGYECFVDSSANILIAVKVPKHVVSKVSAYIGVWGDCIISIVGKNGQAGDILINGQSNATLIKQLTALES